MGNQVGEERSRQGARKRCGIGWLIDLAGPEMGLLDQEIAKLAVFVGDRPTITREDVDQIVGRGRAAETFKIFDAIGAGRPAEALSILERLNEQGEEPLGILGAFSWQLRPLAQAARLKRAGRPLATAASPTREFSPGPANRVEKQLQHLGRRRLDKLLRLANRNGPGHEKQRSTAGSNRPGTAARASCPAAGGIAIALWIQLLFQAVPRTMAANPLSPRHRAMPTAGPLKPSHKAIHAYHETLQDYAGQHVEYEGALETAFSRLLANTARPHRWTIILNQLRRSAGCRERRIQQPLFPRQGFGTIK